MPSSLITLLIVAFAGLFLGIVAGLLLGSLRSEPEDEVKPEQEMPPGGRSGQYLPVMRLWREKTTEVLIVELDGKSYLSTAPLNMAQRESLEKATGELIGWLGAVVAGGPVQAAAASRPVEQPPTPVPQEVSQPAAGEQPSTPPVKFVPAPPPVISPSASAPQVQRLVGISSMPPALEEPKSIVGQIDAILQDTLLRAGMDNRGISLTEDPRKGVIVWVGLEHFDGIDAVTDMEIKGIIRSAVSEWERRQELNSRH